MQMVLALGTGFRPFVERLANDGTDEMLSEVDASFRENPMSVSSAVVEKSFRETAARHCPNDEAKQRRAARFLTVFARLSKIFLVAMLRAVAENCRGVVPMLCRFLMEANAAAYFEPVALATLIDPVRIRRHIHGASVRLAAAEPPSANLRLAQCFLRRLETWVVDRTVFGTSLQQDKTVVCRPDLRSFIAGTVAESLTQVQPMVASVLPRKHSCAAVVVAGAFDHFHRECAPEEYHWHLHRHQTHLSAAFEFSRRPLNVPSRCYQDLPSARVASRVGVLVTVGELSAEPRLIFDLLNFGSPARDSTEEWCALRGVADCIYAAANMAWRADGSDDKEEAFVDQCSAHEYLCATTLHAWMPTIMTLAMRFRNALDPTPFAEAAQAALALAYGATDFGISRVFPQSALLSQDSMADFCLGSFDRLRPECDCGSEGKKVVVHSDSRRFALHSAVDALAELFARVGSPGTSWSLRLDNSRAFGSSDATPGEMLHALMTPTRRVVCPHIVAAAAKFCACLSTMSTTTPALQLTERNRAMLLLALEKCCNVWWMLRAEVRFVRVPLYVFSAVCTLCKHIPFFRRGVEAGDDDHYRERYRDSGSVLLQFVREVIYAAGGVREMRAAVAAKNHELVDEVRMAATAYILLVCAGFDPQYSPVSSHDELASRQVTDDVAFNARTTVSPCRHEMLTQLLGIARETHGMRGNTDGQFEASLCAWLALAPVEDVHADDEAMAALKACCAEAVTRQHAEGEHGSRAADRYALWQSADAASVPRGAPITEQVQWIYDS